MAYDMQDGGAVFTSFQIYITTNLAHLF